MIYIASVAGIQCLDKYEDIIAAVEGSECSFVVQKYIGKFPDLQLYYFCDFNKYPDFWSSNFEITV